MDPSQVDLILELCVNARDAMKTRPNHISENCSGDALLRP